MVTKFQAGWYLIYTMPQHEKKVQSRLAKLSIESFLPTRKTLRSWHDRKRYVDEPLFPNYIFLFLEDMQHYYKGLDTEGALYYVRSGQKVAKVDSSVISSIRLATHSEQDIEVSSEYFRPGQQMVIREGVLTGLTCELIEYKNIQKLLVRVQLLQRNILLTVSSDYLMTV